MLTQEDLQAISQLIKNEVEPINQRLDKMETRLDNIEDSIDELKEDTEITRYSTNQLIKWVEFYYGKEKPFPVDEDEIENQDIILKMID